MKCKCFKCNQKGHWKNDFPKLDMGNLHVIEACLVKNYNDKLIIYKEPLTMYVTLCSGLNNAVHPIKDKEA